MVARTIDRLVSLTGPPAAQVASGDAQARASTAVDPFHWDWENDDAVLTLGSDNKSLNPEIVLFFRFNIENLGPPIEEITRARIEFVTGLVEVDGDGTAGKFRVGFLVNDGVWNHASSVGFTPGTGDGEYEFSYDLPFPTVVDSDTIIAGQTLFGTMAGPFEYTDGTLGTTDHSSSKLSVGDLTGWDAAAAAERGWAVETTWEFEALGAVIQSFRALDYKYVAFVFDAYDVPSGTSEYMQIYSEDSTALGASPGDGVWGAHLILEYDVVDEVRSVSHPRIK